MSASIQGYRDHRMREVNRLDGVSPAALRVMGMLIGSINAKRDDIDLGLDEVIDTHGNWKHRECLTESDFTNKLSELCVKAGLSDLESSLAKELPRSSRPRSKPKHQGCGSPADPISVGESSRSGEDHPAEAVAREDRGSGKKGSPSSSSRAVVVEKNTGPAGAPFCIQLLVSNRGAFSVRLKDCNATRKFSGAMGIDKGRVAVAAIQSLPALLDAAQPATWSSECPPTIVGKGYGYGSLQRDFDSLKRVIVAVRRDDTTDCLFFKSTSDSHASVVKNAKGKLGEWRKAEFWEPMVKEAIDLHVSRGTSPKASSLHRALAGYAKSVAPNGALSSEGVLKVVGKLGLQTEMPRASASPSSASSNSKAGEEKGEDEEEEEDEDEDDENEDDENEDEEEDGDEIYEEGDKEKGKRKRATRPRWTEDEHRALLRAWPQHKRDWEALSKIIRTRTAAQIYHHARYHFVTKGGNSSGNHGDGTQGAGAEPGSAAKGAAGVGLRGDGEEKEDGTEPAAGRDGVLSGSDTEPDLHAGTTTGATRTPTIVVD
eukprot:g7340.t1